MQWSLIWELMLYKFWSGPWCRGCNQKYLLCKRGKRSWWQYSKQMVSEILIDLQEPWQSGRPKTVDSQVVLQTWEANLMSSTQRVWVELGSSQSNVVYQLDDLTKISGAAELSRVTKILQNFWLTRVYLTMDRVSNLRRCVFINKSL